MSYVSVGGTGGQDLDQKFEAFKVAWREFYSVSWARQVAAVEASWNPILRFYDWASGLDIADETDRMLALQRTAENNLALVQRGVDRVKAGDTAHAPAVINTIDRLIGSMSVTIPTSFGLAWQAFKQALADTVPTVKSFALWTAMLTLVGLVVYERVIKK